MAESKRQHIKKVAIVGSGCAGIAALWALNRTYHDVYLYEASDRLGGHTNTVQWTNGKFSTAVDTGFIALNTATYPNFLSFLTRVGVETEPTDAGLSLSRDQGSFEWAGRNLSALFCQRRNIFSLRMWRILFDVYRFNQFAIDLLADDGREKNSAFGSEETMEEYLDREGYSAAFRHDYLIPMTASFWSARPEKSTLDFPARALVQHLWNHRLLRTVGTQPQWLTLKNGSQSYIDAVMKGFPPNHLFLKTPVRRISNTADGRVVLHLESGAEETYDHVVLATHGDQALSILGGEATTKEREILSAFKTVQSEAVLHSDTALMPQRKPAWSSWNYLTSSSSSSSCRSQMRIEKACVTYNMNIIQQIPRHPFGDVLLTLNPIYRPRAALTKGRYFYSHPVHSAAAVAAQTELRSIQNVRGISYAGAWTRHGSHEDAFTSGLAVARDYLGARLPFDLSEAGDGGKRPKLSMLAHLVRLLILIVQVFVIQVLERLSSARQPSLRLTVKGLRTKRLNGKAM